MKHLLFFALVLSWWVLTSCPVSAQSQPPSKEAEIIFAEAQKLYYGGSYQQAIEKLTTAAALYEKVNNIAGVVSSLNLQGESLSTLNQCDKALEVLKRSQKLAATRLPADHPDVAQNYYYLSIATGKCARKIDDAIKLLNKSLPIKEKLYGRASVEIAFDYTFMGFLYDNKEMPDSALAYLNKALDIRKKKLPDDDIEIAYTLHNLAQVYENQSELNKSLAHHLRALKIRQTKLGDAHLTTLHSINAIGSVYRKFGNFERALDYYRYALENRKKALGENHADVSCSYYSIANLCKDMYDYHTAIQYYLQGHRILENLYGVNTDVLPAYYAVTAKMYGMVGEHQMALEYINKAEETADNNLAKDHAYRGITYNYIGDYYAEINDLGRYTEYFNKAIAIFHKAYGVGSVREGDILFRMGDVSAKNRRFPEAKTYYENARAIFASKMGSRNPKTASVLHALGDVFRNQGQSDEALNFFRQAFVAISTYKDIADLYLNPRADELESKFLALQIAGSKGQALFAQALKRNDLIKLEQSVTAYDLAMQLIDHIIAGYNSENAKMELEKESRKIYVQAMQTVYELYQRTHNSFFLEKAFAISEKSKSPLLLENIRDGWAKTSAGVREELVNSERDIKIELAYYQNERYHARKEKLAAKIKVCEKNIFIAQQKYDSLKEKLEREFPAYYEVKYNMNTADITDLQNLIPDQKTVAVEFFTGDNAVYIFTVTKNKVQLDRKTIDEDYKSLFRDYEKSLSNAEFILNSRLQADKLYVTSAHLLYELLLGSAFTPGAKIEKLILIPDDMLAQFNFGTLITKKPGGESPDYKTLDYLTRRCRVSYAYSSTFLRNKPQGKNQSRYSFAGFAPSYSGRQFSNLDSTLHPLAYRVVRDGDLPLPGAEQEVRYLTRFMSGTSWLNVEATETNFKQHAGDYNILHLAMHSLLNTDNPEYSELLFNAEEDKVNDGFLNVSEIYNLNLNAQLVVLSACSSGYGKIQKGEGPISISRAFSYAGCPSVVMSLWKVPDNITQQIMIAFYQALKAGHRKDEALRAAQLKFLNETGDPLYHHPYYWAGFVVMGDTEPLSEPFPWSMVMAGITIIIAAIVFTWMKRGRNAALIQVEKEVHPQPHI